jgi:GTPase SAR1 family protein
MQDDFDTPQDLYVHTSSGCFLFVKRDALRVLSDRWDPRLCGIAWSNGAGNANSDYETRYTLLGMPASGKTSFRMRCADDTFLETYVRTVGVEVSQRVCKLKGGRVVMMLHLADGPGSGSNVTISDLLKHSDGICLVFDFSQRATFDALAEILEGARA